MRRHGMSAVMVGVALLGAMVFSSPAIAAETTSTTTSTATNNDQSVAALTFDANGGQGYYDDVIFVGPEEAVFPGADRSNAAAPGIPFSRAGYTFNGWNTKADGTGTQFEPGDKISVKQAFALDTTGGVIVYAQWKSNDAPTEYTVSFDKNGGAGDISTITTVNKKMTISWDKWKTFSRPGYVFYGFNTKADGTGNSGFVYNRQVSVSSDITLFAQWEKLHTISFNLNGAKGSVQSILDTKDNSIQFPNATARDGYTFKGWTQSKDGSGILYKAGSNGWWPTTDTTFYAQWERTTSGNANNNSVKPLPYEELSSSNQGNISLGSTLVSGSMVRVYLNALPQNIRNSVDSGEQVRMYAFIYSTPKALRGENGSAYSLIHKDGKRYYINAFIPAGYSGVHSIAVYDQNGTLQGWKATTISEQQTSTSANKTDTLATTSESTVPSSRPRPTSANKTDTLATTGSSVLPFSLATIVMMVIGSGLGILRKFLN